MIININKKKFHVNENEFNKVILSGFENLHILENLGLFERLISLIIELKDTSNIKNLICFNTCNGGYIPIECSSSFDNILLIDNILDSEENIHNNITLHNIKNIKFKNNIFLENNFGFSDNSPCILFSETPDFNIPFLKNMKENILITKYNLNLINNDNIFKYVFHLKNTDYFIYLNENNIHRFKEIFEYYLEYDNDNDNRNDNNNKNILNYDNLIHLCIMVKNAGPQFEDMLTQNLSFFDRWTILDTGSTDETINIINKVLVGKKHGNLYQEPFINFRDSRNRCLDLAGTACKFIVTLDDTYILSGDFRQFFHKVRGDQLSNSFSIFIKDKDFEYASNRIIKSHSRLRYIYKIHEVINVNDNINIIIPKINCYIKELNFDYMEVRTASRKELDLKLLFEEIEENPFEPRTYYYIAQTYIGLKNYEKAYEYYLKRADFYNSGFTQERIDAIFEAARLANFELNKPWEECLKLYEKAYSIDETRPESQYFIGVHYYYNNNISTAYKYFKKAFEIGFPRHTQYSLKPTLSFHFLPSILCNVCYLMKDYKLGEEASELFLKNNINTSDSYNNVLAWNNIYKKLNLCPSISCPIIPVKPLFCFVADGGFEPWTGKDILTNGVGGAETYIIEMSKYIQLSGHYDVIVFCNCLKEEKYENVIYKPLISFYSFINSCYVHTCVVSRFSEYLPVACNGYTESVYLVVHDLLPSGNVIPIEKKLKNIFCLTEWHVSYFNNIFPMLSHLTVPFYNGVDIKKFNKIGQKIPFKFIYSSFPNRGLLPLLQMWPKIYEKQPLATLHIYADINGNWVNNVEPEQMKMIKTLLEDYSKRENNLGIYNHGWVDKETLADAWSTADIWFYPCIFQETFCITALEAALSKTFVITNNLAGLQNTVGDRGIHIEGNPMELLWQEKALEKIFYFFDKSNMELKKSYIEKNYQWSLNLSWENQANHFLNKYILPNNKLEHKQMFNWTNHIPSEQDTAQFYKVMDYFNDTYVNNSNNNITKVLEIGTYTGISIINIVKHIHNSIGVAIDKWENYIELENNKLSLMNYIQELEVEKSFYKNIEKENLQSRIKVIKGDSKNILLNMIHNKEYYDFIYLDGSHKSFDCYLDVYLSWKLLNNGGILGIDDYLFNTEDKLETPYYAINKFLSDIKDESKILHTGYRIFIQKNI